MTIPRQWIDLLKGLVRTGVPIGVAALVSWLRQRGVDWIPEWGGTYLIPVGTGIGYWLLIRLGELKLSPEWGVFLLAVGGPVYETARGALNEATEPVLVEVPKTAEVTVEYHPGGVLESPPPYVPPVEAAPPVDLGSFDLERFRDHYE